MTEIKDIWHLPPETPDVFQAWQVLVIYEAGDQREFMASNEFSWRTANRYVNRWCYVDELLKDYADTKKKLDIAVDALNYLRRTNPICYQMECIEKALEQIKDKEE